MTTSTAITLAALCLAALNVSACSSGSNTTTHEVTNTTRYVPVAPTSTTTTTTHTQVP